MADLSDSFTESSTLCIDSLSTYTEAIERLKESYDESAQLVERINSQAPGPSSSSFSNGQTSAPDWSALPNKSLANFPGSFPAVKRIPHSTFVVDGFRHAGPWSVSYFLSHFHSDHYSGITNLWCKGLIFCSEITARLVKQILQVPDGLVVQLPLGKPVVIDGCEVSLVDANHCPGAVQFLFRVPGPTGDGLRYVHCGDMRYHPPMKCEPSLYDFVGADGLFLDTTYCNPKYGFPSQEESVGYVAETVHRIMEADSGVVLGMGTDDQVADSMDEEREEKDEGADSMEEEKDHGDKSRAELQTGSELLQFEAMEEEEHDDKILPEIQTGIEALYNEKTVVGEKVDVDNANVEMQKKAEPSGKVTVEAELDDEDDVVESYSGPVEGKSTLFLISTYVIGKEKILTAVAKRCNSLVYVTEKKLSVLKCLNLDDINIFTTDAAATNVHVVQWNFLGETWPYFRPNYSKMEKAMKDRGYRKVVGFVPTGWTYELKKKTFSVRKKGPCEIHLVPYSEHSNYQELREYVGFMRPKQIFPTVGLEGGGMDSKSVAAMRKHFRNLVDETAGKKKFLMGFHRKPPDQVDSTLSQTDDPVPKAVFGRSAKKRKRDDGELEEAEIDERDLQQLRGKALTFEAELPFGGKMLSGGVPSTSCVSPVKVGIRELSASKNPVGSPKVPQSMFEMSKSNLALSSDKEEIKDDRNASRSNSATPLGRKKGTHDVAIERARSGQKSRVRRNSASKGSTSRSQMKAQGRQTKSSASKKVKTTMRSSAQSPKTSSSGPESFQKAKQVSLLSFFKKAGDDVVSDTNARLNADHLGIASSSTCVDDGGKHTQREVQEDVNKWADEYEQLASLLDENLSKEFAHRLLEKAGGDVGLALDLYYSSEVKHTVEVQDQGSAAVLEPLAIPSPLGNQNLSVNGETKAISSNLVERSRIVGPVDEEPLLVEDEKRFVGSNGTIDGVKDFAVESTRGSEGIPDKSSVSRAAHSPCVGSPSTHAVSNFSTIAGTLMQQSSKPSNETLNSSNVGPLRENDCKASSDHKISSSQKLQVKIKEEHEYAQLKGDKHQTGKKNSDVRTSGSVAVPVVKYSPIEHACWKLGEDAPYLHLARAFDLIEQETGRLRTADMLCNMFRSLLALSPDAVLPAVYLTTNRLAPDFEGTDLNIGGSIVSTAVGEVAGVPRSRLRDMYTSLGDLGDVAQACRQTQSILRLPPPLRICKVFATLKQISKESGPGSSSRKKDLVLNLLRACREKEMKYMVRTLIQNMRIGAMMKTVLGALAQAIVLHHSAPLDRAPTSEALLQLKPKFQEAAIAVVEAYNFLPNLDLLVPTLVKGGIAALSGNLSISPGTPIKPMLAKITNGIPELLKRFEGQSFTCEYKYDGQRAQIHLLTDGTFRVFSRNCEDTTGRFPDVANLCKTAAREDLTSFIIDAEIVAVDRDNGNKLMAFQHLSTRERGSRDGGAVNVQNIKVSVCVFVFDMMYANGKSLVKMSLRERRKCMHDWFPNTQPGYFGYAAEITIDSEDYSTDSSSLTQKIEGFLEETFSASCEGLMAKALDLDSNYMASKRSDSWLKIKRDYVEGLNDSLDLVPIGAWYGNGRKAGWYSPFLLACYDPEREEYQSVCRVMSGFTDSFYKEMKEFYSGDRILPRKPSYYRTGEECSLWFSPELVWEIRGADFTVSPVHQAAVGLVHPDRGISMRFPRYIRSRPDKNPETSTTPSDIAELFSQQTRKVDVGKREVKSKTEPASSD